MTFPFGYTVTITRRTIAGTDANGVDTFTTTSKTVENVPAWNPAFGDQEVVQGADQVTSDMSIWLPASTAIGELDAVTVSGDQYEVKGRPVPFVSPFTGTSGLLAHLRRVTG